MTKENPLSLRKQGPTGQSPERRLDGPRLSPGMRLVSSEGSNR